jgi:galactose-1-phosphate uridylyltransferase
MSQGPDETVMDFWDEVVDDMEATAAEYRDNGWDAIEVHPGDVTALPPDHERFGLDVLVPDNEYDTVSEAVETGDGEFDSFEVFRASAGGTVFLVVAVEDKHSSQVVLVPAFYNVREAADTLTGARERGELPIHLRTLSADEVVTFEPSDPDPLFPEGDE